MTTTTSKPLGIITLSAILRCHAPMVACWHNKEKTFYIPPFIASIVNSYYAQAYSVMAVLDEKGLKIIFSINLAKSKYTTVFAAPLKPSDTLLQLVQSI